MTWSKFDTKDVLAAYKALLSLAEVLKLLFECNEDETTTMMNKGTYNLKIYFTSEITEHRLCPNALLDTYLHRNVEFISYILLHVNYCTLATYSY